MSGVSGVCSRAAWLRSLVWCVSSAGPPESKVASSLAYIKNRLKPNPHSMDATLQGYHPALRQAWDTPTQAEETPGPPANIVEVPRLKTNAADLVKDAGGLH